MKGNVIDLAVGVVIGAAFGKIVSSLVADVIMPPLGLLIGNVNFSDLAVHIGTDPKGKEVLLRYGVFLQTLFEFLIIALVLFMVIKGINRLKRPAAGARPPAAPPPPPREEVLLEEIRDLLQARRLIDGPEPVVAAKASRVRFSQPVRGHCDIVLDADAAEFAQARTRDQLMLAPRAVRLAPHSATDR